MNSGASPGRTTRNVLATVGAQVLTWAFTFVVTLFLPRYVGASGLGKFAFAGSIVAVCGVVVPMGTSTVLVKEIARDRSRTGDLLAAALLLRTPLALIMLLLAVVLTRWLGHDREMAVLALCFGTGMVIGALSDALGAALQGQENLPRQNGAALADKLIGAVLTVALIFAHAPLWALAAVVIVGASSSLALNLSAFPGLIGMTLRSRPSLAAMRRLAAAGMPFFGLTVFQTLYGQTDPVVLRLVASNATVGWYAAAFRLVGTTMFLPTAVCMALLPTLSRLYSENEGDFVLMARRMLTLLLLAGVPISLVLVCAPVPLLALLHYPASFAPSAPVLRVAGVGVFLWFAGSALGTAVIAADRQQALCRAALAACVLGIPACALGSVLGARLLGNAAVGAMVSDVALEAFLVACYLRALPVGLFGVESLWLAVRCGMAALPMAALLLYAARSGGWEALWMVAPCLALYGALCIALRCLDVRQYMAMARAAVASRGARA